MIIATHDGTFHADETTACAILSYLFDNVSVIRSRDPDVLESGDIVMIIIQRILHFAVTTASSMPQQVLCGKSMVWTT